MAPTGTDVRTGTSDPASELSAKRVHLDRYGVDIGPLGHLAAERARLADLSWDRFDVRPLGATIGVEIGGVDLTSDLEDEMIAELRRALLEYKVIFFRDQPITGEQHIALARRFGDLEVHPFLPANPELPELVRFTKDAETGGYENGWHSDVTWRETPSMGAILHAIEVPASGGDTLFCDMAAAYDGLSEEMKQRIDGLTAVNDYALAFGHGLDEAGRAEMNATFPPVEHPMVRTHPETGRKLVYVNAYFVDRVVGMGEDEGNALLRELIATTRTVEYQCRFHWEKDSIAFWDNRAVQHLACSDYWPDVRIMERASIVGDPPF